MDGPDTPALLLLYLLSQVKIYRLVLPALLFNALWDDAVGHLWQFSSVVFANVLGACILNSFCSRFPYLSPWQRDPVFAQEGHDILGSFGVPVVVGDCLILVNTCRKWWKIKIPGCLLDMNNLLEISQAEASSPSLWPFFQADADFWSSLPSGWSDSTEMVNFDTISIAFNQLFPVSIVNFIFCDVVGCVPPPTPSNLLTEVFIIYRHEASE